MSAFDILAWLLTIAAVFAYVNHRWLKLPAAIGLMAMSLGVSLLLIAVDRLGWVSLVPTATRLLDRIELDTTLLQGMLGALLFAGALHIDLKDLREEIAPVIALAIVSTLLSTALVGGALYAITRLLDVEVGFGHCLLFGALISPTDPVAVIGVLKGARVPKRLETQIAGESLLNDGVGVVLFITILGVVEGGGDANLSRVVTLFVREAVGGAVFGVAAGYLTFRLLRSIDHYQTELLLTLSLVLGGYALAQVLHISAPIAAVVSGLLIGNMGRSHAMSDTTRDHLDKFWSLVDEILNAVLFVLVGFEVIRLDVQRGAIVAGVLAVFGVLLSRLLSIAAPLHVLSRWRRNDQEGQLAILTWGGLRGGISVALALSIPLCRERSFLVSTTYIVVIFSVLLKGLTLGRFARFLIARSGRTPERAKSTPA